MEAERYRDMSDMTRRWMEALKPLVSEITYLHRKGEYMKVLQQYDLVLAASEVTELAEDAVRSRDELMQAEQIDLKANVLDPKFVAQRMRAVSQKKQNANRGFSASPEAEDRDACSDDAKALYAMENEVEKAWGLALLSAMQLHPHEEEHHDDIIDEFQDRFQRASPFLSAIKNESSSAIECLQIHEAREHELSADVVKAALIKHSPSNTNELGQLLAFLKSKAVTVPVSVGELLEMAYVRCMKDEGAENVFEKMVQAGLPPMSTRPFAMLFNTKKPTKVASVLDYYELMLDYGIPPESSVFRILTKQTSGTAADYASHHFTVCLKRLPAGSAMSPLSPLSPTSPGSPGSPGSPSSPTGTGDTRRRGDRLYFEKRLDELLARYQTQASTAAAAAAAATVVPTTGSGGSESTASGVMEQHAPPLMEAMKMVHRAEVEGTSLEGDTLILGALLRNYCNGTTPLKDLIYPFSASQAYGPQKVVLAREEDSAGDPRSPIGAARNMFDFELDGAEDECLEDAPSPTGETLQQAAEAETLREECTAQSEVSTEYEYHQPMVNHRSQNGQPRFKAFQNEEAAYVLKVLSLYGSVPDNKLVKSVSAHCQNKLNGLAVVEQVVLAMFNAGHDSRGAVEAVRCSHCHSLLHHFVHRHQRNRLLNLLRHFVTQCFEYTALFHADWSSGIDANGKQFLSFATAAMKAGPLDWALGLFVVALLMADQQVLSDAVKNRLQYFASSDYQTPHHRILPLLEKCGWSRRAIFACDELMLSAAELSAKQQQRAAGEAAPETTHVDTEPAQEPSKSPEGEKIGRSIYTTSDQEVSSYNNTARTAEEMQPLSQYMYMTLRDMNVDKPVLEWYQRRLREERQAALTV